MSKINEGATVNYEKIYEVINNHKGRFISAAQIAFSMNIDRIYGGTMAKLVREGVLEHAPAKGYYHIIGRD